MSTFLLDPGGTPHLAGQSCAACRKLKRKCDKSIPACGLCHRTGRSCDYSAPQQLLTASEVATLQTRLVQLEEVLRNGGGWDCPPRLDSGIVVHSDIPTPGSAGSATVAASNPPTEFLAALFLDIDFYKWAGMCMPSPTISIPMQVLTILGHENALQDTALAYFQTVHTWFPIISKKRMDIGNSLRNGGPDLAMLFLAMKLITTKPEGVTIQESPLYSTAKSFLVALEASGKMSLNCLQAMILIALFEYSHAIYPAAWMTVGACVRYADMLGVSCGKDHLGVLPPCTSWLEVEERRRAWWAIYILDRVISLGSRRRFSASEPPDSGILPVDDTAWAQGNKAQARTFSVSTPQNIPQTPFARLCQSATMIGRAASCRNLAQKDAAAAISRTKDLIEVLCSFNTILEAQMVHAMDQLALMPSCSLTLSALFCLLDAFCCPEKVSDEPGYAFTGQARLPEEHALQTQANYLLQQASEQASTLSKDLLDIIETTGSQPDVVLGMASPLNLDAFYCAVATFHWNRREGGGELNLDFVCTLNSCLQELGERWGLAEKYRLIAEYHDPTHKPNLLFPLSLGFGHSYN